MNKTIYVAGHNGLVGSSICRALALSGDTIVTRSRSELDLLSQRDTLEFFEAHNFDEVYLSAAKVGGIHANNEYRGEFIYENLMVQSNVVHSAYLTGVPKLLFLGSSCIYPKYSKQPISESELLSGPLEPTNEPYAIAKIAGIKLCESYNEQYSLDYRSVMPTNLYGPNDNFDEQNSHVIPSLISRFHEAKENGATTVEIWGSGSPRREFLYVDDMAKACLHVMGISSVEYQKSIGHLSHVNIGSGLDCSIRYLALAVSTVVGYQGDIVFDHSKPDGTPRKQLDVSLLESMGWRSEVSLEDGLSLTYQWFLNNADNLRKK